MAKKEVEFPITRNFFIHKQFTDLHPQVCHVWTSTKIKLCKIEQDGGEVKMRVDDNCPLWLLLRIPIELTDEIQHCFLGLNKRQYDLIFSDDKQEKEK